MYIRRITKESRDKFMIYLPYPPNRMRLRSFWLVLSLLGGLVTCSLLEKLMPGKGLALGALISFGVAVGGVLQPGVASLPYRAFNRLAGLLGRYTTELLVMACYCVACTAVGNKASIFKAGQPDDWNSLWIPIGKHAGSDFNVMNGVSVIESPDKSPFRAVIKWAIKSGNWWACTLIPFMSLIAILGKEELRMTVPENVYTLY